ncbi:MAG: hypothetical protein QOG68_2218 [Solirubrobacteraceae bacterium]|nr:hypothetical protein [Solirubrobacteraceae bacterium]
MSSAPRSLLSILVPQIADGLAAALAEAGPNGSGPAWSRVVEALREADTRYRALIEHVPVVIYVAAFDDRATLRYVSPRIEELTGRTPEELLADDEEWYRSIHPDDLERVRSSERAAFKAKGELDSEFRLVHRDGRVVFVWERDVLVRDEAGVPLFSQGVLLDVTSLRTTESALRAERDRAQRYLDVAEVTLVAVDAEGRVTMLNRAGHELLGYPDGELIGVDFFAQCLPEEARSGLLEGYHRRLPADEIIPQYETEVLCRDGSRRLMLWQTKVLREDGQPVGLLSSGTDVTDRRQAQEQIAHMAYHDSLTGLPNRAMLREHLEFALARAQRAGQSLALLYLDLDDFKLVNDGLGHAAGDDLLRTMAARLRARLREEDLIAREGGDEFLVLLADLSGDPQERALSVAESLVQALREPFKLRSAEFEVNGSIGISVFPRDATDAEGLLMHADSAMYEAKAAGRGQVRVFSGAQHRSPDRLSLSRRLRRAIEEDELVLHWQPIVELISGDLAGIEGLVRWQDPERGLLPAGDFVEAMASAGLLEKLDEWVASALTAQRRDWQAVGLDPYVGFNLGPHSLDTRRIDGLLSRLRDGGMNLDHVTIEISESDALRDDTGARAALERLHAEGLTLALDDFGVAYSSLSRLRDVPADWIKIDRSFLVGVPDDPGATHVLDAILQLLDALGARVVVEGVETEAQLEHLRVRPCYAAQGYHLGRPQSAAQLEPVLRQSASAILGASRSNTQIASTQVPR